MEQNVMTLVGSNFAIDINFDFFSLSSNFFSWKITGYIMLASLIKALVTRPN